MADITLSKGEIVPVATLTKMVDMGDGTHAPEVSTVLNAGSDHAGQVGGNTAIVSDSYVRADNTTQYTAGDQVADATPSVLTFAAPRISGGTGVIIHAVCVDSVNAAVKPDLRLYLFSATPTVVTDNLAWTPSDANMATLIGYVNFSSWEEGLAGAAGNCASFASNINIPFDAVAASIFGLAVMRNTYTPASGETFTFNLGVLQD